MSPRLRELAGVIQNSFSEEYSEKDMFLDHQTFNASYHQVTKELEVWKWKVDEFLIGLRRMKGEKK